MTISPEFRRRLVVMVKEPRAGRVKTRLGREIGMTAAAWWFRHQTRSLLRRLQSPSWELIVAVSPDKQGLISRFWPKNLPKWPQGRGDLGDRMKRIFDKMPPGPVLIIGADIPGISSVHISKAFKALGSNDAVFGPAPDGGFWLVGLKRARPTPKGMFEKVRWSSKFALSDTLRSIDDARVAIIDTLLDVDQASDL